MTILWVVPAILAPILWAVSNLVDEHLVLDTELDATALVLVTGLFTSLPALLLVRGNWPGTPTALLAMSAGALGVAVYFPYFRALAHESASMVVLMWNLSPVLMHVLAMVTIRETLSTSESVAIGLLVGSASVAGYRRRGASWSRAIPWMVVASILLAGSSVLEKAVYERLPFAEGLAWISLGTLLATVATAALAARSRRRVVAALRSPLGRVLLGNEALDLGAICSMGLATSLGAVSLVHAVGGLQPLFVALARPITRTSARRPSELARTLLASGLAVVGLALLNSR
jgi:drug/metabolite transporter (DMT)-like permease